MEPRAGESDQAMAPISRASDPAKSGLFARLKAPITAPDVAEGDDRWALFLLRVAAVVVLLSQLAIAISDLAIHPWTPHATAVLYAFNVLVAVVFGVLTTSEWMLKRWRHATLGGCACLLGSIAAISTLEQQPEFLFISALFLPLAAGALLPWQSKWQDGLALMAGCAFAGLALFGATPDPTPSLHWVAIATAVAVGHFAARVSAQRRAELERQHYRLSESEAVLLKALDSILDPLAINDMATGRYIKVNEEFLQLANLGREEVIGKTCAEIPVWPENPLSPADVERFLKEGRLRNAEATFRLRDGRLMPCLISTVKVELGGRQCMLSVARDITELKATQRQLEAAREAALAASRAKSEFLSSMSHEIRTPMNAILGMADLLAETALSPEQRRFVDTMTRNGNALHDLINGVLDLAKIESGRLHLEETEFELEDLIEHVAETLAVRAHEKGLELITRVAPEVPMRLMGDPLRLRQVLINLVGNAIKFTEQGEVVLTVEREPGGQGGNDLRFSVRDTGIGIPSHKLDTIFQSFTQADSSTTRRFGGSGLGLAIARRLVELMGGRIAVESQVDKGSTFYFTVRLQAAESRRAGLEGADALQGIRVLIVDDNATSRAVLCDLLMRAGAEVAQAEGAAQGLELLERGCASKRPFGLLIVDCRMPAVSGHELVRQVRSVEALRTLPIVGLACEELGPADSTADELRVIRIRKPVRRAELFGAVTIATGREAVTARRSAPASPPPAPPAERPLRILLAEDSRDNRLLIDAYVKDLPYRLEVAENGEIAVRKFRAGRFDLVLMDVQMPVMDGYDAVRQIRLWEREQGLAPVPIVALTASALQEDVRNSLKAGCTAHLSKPVKKARLLEVIRALTGDARASGSGVTIEDEAASARPPIAQA